MRGMTIGLVTEQPMMGAEWAGLIQACGYSVYGTGIRTPLPTQQIDLWLVILDPRTAPSRVALWLRQMRSRIVLVTPHLQAGQSLATWVPSLCLVCAPLQARDGINDVLALAQSISSGMITLSTPTQVHLC